MDIKVIINVGQKFCILCFWIAMIQEQLTTYDYTKMTFYLSFISALYLFNMTLKD